MLCAQGAWLLPTDMDSLYLLIPLSIVLVLAIGGLLVWAVMSGQFENLDAEGRRILDDEAQK